MEVAILACYAETMIPGWLISVATFPGVILHEFAHKFFCDRFGVKVHEVSYFNMSGGGHVIHDRTDNFNAIFWISTGPLIINSITAVVFAAIAGSMASEDGMFLLLLWLAVSFGAHSFPSNQDASNVLDASKQIIKNGGNLLHYLSFPFVWLIAIANLLRFFWIDFIWAIALVIFGFSMSSSGGVGNDFFDTTSSPTSNYNYSNNYSADGDYDCTDYHSRQADALGPSLEDDVSLEYDRLDLEELGDEIDALNTRLENMYVNEYSSQEVNAYNAQVDRLQRMVTQYQVDSAAYDRQLEAYNKKVNAYNNYLEANCRSTN